MVNPDKAVPPPAATLTLKILLLLFPEIVNRLAAGPWIVRLLAIDNSPVVNVIGLVTWPADMSNVIVLPTQASATACRNEPAPLSLLLVTIGEAIQLTVKVKLASVVEPQLSVARIVMTWSPEG